MPPSVRYYNQAAPFWDWVATLEDQNASGNMFNRGNHPGWGWSPPQFGAWPWGQHGSMPHRGRNHEPASEDEDNENTPLTPPAADGEEEMPAPVAEGSNQEKEQPPSYPGPGARHGGGPHGGHGRRHRGHSHDRRGRGAHDRGGFGGFGGGRERGRGPQGCRRGPFNFGDLFNQFTGQDDPNQDFKPAVDVFDTETSFVIHVSLAGAKKGDTGVSWDPEKSELTITGVIHRPGDEDFLKTLALDERKVGAFERKVRLGSPAHPALIEVDAITAKLEDGVLTIEVPKQDRDFVEVKKIDIE